MAEKVRLTDRQKALIVNALHCAKIVYDNDAKICEGSKSKLAEVFKDQSKEVIRLAGILDNAEDVWLYVDEGLIA